MKTPNSIFLIMFFDDAQGGLRPGSSPLDAKIRTRTSKESGPMYQDSEMPKASARRLGDSEACPSATGMLRLVGPPILYEKIEITNNRLPVLLSVPDITFGILGEKNPLPRFPGVSRINGASTQPPCPPSAHLRALQHVSEATAPAEETWRDSPNQKLLGFYGKQVGMGKRL